MELGLGNFKLWMFSNIWKFLSPLILNGGGNNTREIVHPVMKEEEMIAIGSLELLDWKFVD